MKKNTPSQSHIITTRHDALTLTMWSVSLAIRSHDTPFHLFPRLPPPSPLPPPLASFPRLAITRTPIRGTRVSMVRYSLRVICFKTPKHTHPHIKKKVQSTVRDSLAFCHHPLSTRLIPVRHGTTTSTHQQSHQNSSPRHTRGRLTPHPFTRRSPQSASSLDKYSGLSRDFASATLFLFIITTSDAVVSLPPISRLDTPPGLSRDFARVKDQSRRAVLVVMPPPWLLVHTFLHRLECIAVVGTVRSRGFFPGFDL